MSYSHNVYIADSTQDFTTKPAGAIVMLLQAAFDHLQKIFLDSSDTPEIVYNN